MNSVIADEIMCEPFSGSYRPEDCLFLLKPLRMVALDVAQKERLIQSGQRHYSELLTPESPPSSQYVELFWTLVTTHRRRLATDLVALAAHIIATRPQPLTIVSLARAGTPVGALLARAFRHIWQLQVPHYSLSIIRDRGIDHNALRYLLNQMRRPAAGLVFVDGWSAKGVITRELKRAIADWNNTYTQASQQLDDRLYVLADIGGSADVAATISDYAIPSGILNATVSGLISRSILNEQIGANDFHGCVLYSQWHHLDVSTQFLDQISDEFQHVSIQPLRLHNHATQAAIMNAWLTHCMETNHIQDVNFIKPGVAEATRVLLRRVPERVLIRDLTHPDVAHLVRLAQERHVTIVQEPTLPFMAAAFIRTNLGSISAARYNRSYEP
jgi:hypothetical protein